MQQIIHWIIMISPVREVRRRRWPLQAAQPAALVVDRPTTVATTTTDNHDSTTTTYICVILSSFYYYYFFVSIRVSNVCVLYL